MVSERSKDLKIKALLLKLAPLYTCLIIVLILFSAVDAQTKEGFAAVNGIKLYYKSIGDGEPIVILHGGPGFDHTYLFPQLSGLAQNHQLIFYDQRASGKSGGVVDSATMTRDQFVEDLEGLRAALKIRRLNLIGHSWGGLLAMSYATKYPQNMKSLVLVNSAGASSDYIGPFLQVRTERTLHQDSLDLGRIQSTQEFKEFRPSAINEFLRTLFHTYVYDKGSLDSLNINFSSHTAKNMLPIFTVMGGLQFDLRPKLSAIKCPTLIVHGDYDVVLPRFAEEIHSLIPQSRYTLLSHCGHFSFVEQPEQFRAECLSFLNSIHD